MPCRVLSLVRIPVMRGRTQSPDCLESTTADITRRYERAFAMHGETRGGTRPCSTLKPMLRYAITDRSNFTGEEVAQQAALLRQAGQLASDGIDFLQLR